MINMNETPIVPQTDSVVPNTQQARPDLGRFQISPVDSNPTSNGSGRETTGPSSNGNGISTPPQVIESIPVPEPPIVKLPAARIVSQGVINGKATSLPVPSYPAPARAVNAQGAVNVQVMIEHFDQAVGIDIINGPEIARFRSS